MATDLTRALEWRGPIAVDAEIGPARAAMLAYRRAYQFASAGKLLTWPAENSKLEKGDAINYSLSLAPADQSEYANVCRHSTPGCREHCVAHSGNGAYPSTTRGRVWKTRFLAYHTESFMAVLVHEIHQAIARHPDNVIHIRLNNYSDLRWERIAPGLFEQFPDVQFYDYTKWPERQRNAPDNYHLTYSWTGERDRKFSDNVNVAVVFDTKKNEPLPEFWNGRQVIDGDTTDGRYDDGVGVFVGLRAKGSARRDTSGFVIKLNNEGNVA